MESPMKKLKFVCSYGGKIQFISGNGSLRYIGGETRIIAVPQSVTFTDLSLKLAEMCGGTLVSLRCKLPNEDLDFFVTITFDDELQNLVQLYESHVSKSTELMIKAFLSPCQPKIKTLKSLVAKKKLKFVCSYGGKLLPSYCDGSLRYKCGETRIIAVPISITFAALSLKLAEIYGGSLVTLRCKLPNEDLDFLITVRSDEELQNLVQVYESQAPHSTETKIKAFLSQWQPKNKTLIPLSPPTNKCWPVLRPTAPSSSTTIAGNYIYQPSARYSRTQTLGAEGMVYYRHRVPVSYQQSPIIMKTGYNHTVGFPQHHINSSSQFGLAC